MIDYNFKIRSLHFHNKWQCDLKENKRPLICCHSEKLMGRIFCIYSFFRWYDLWIGFYWDKKSKALYFIPIPTIGLKLQF